MTHTPGPWFASPRIGGITITNQHTKLAEINYRRSGAKRGMPVQYHVGCCDAANARLIAAAPSLLAALKAILDDPQIGLDMVLCDIVKTAIAKAEDK